MTKTELNDMKTFAISWISFFDNELHTKIAKFDSLAEAELAALSFLLGTPTYDLDTNDYKRLAFDCDGMINAVEVAL